MEENSSRKSKLFRLALAVVPALIVFGLVYAADVYYNLDANIVVFNESATTTFAGPIAQSSGDFILGSAVGNLLFNPYGGNIGIATTTPRYLLDVWGDFGVGTSTAISSTEVVPAFYVTSKDRPQIGIGTTTVGSNLLTVGTTTPALVVDANGYVGIGTSTPIAVLSVHASTTSPLELARFGNTALGDGEGTGYILLPRAMDSSRGILFGEQMSSVNSGNYAVIASQGDVSQSISIFGGLDGSSNRGDIWFQEYGGNVGIGDNSPDFGLEIMASSSNGYFAVSSGGAYDGNLFLIDGTGNVGIATTSPRYKLDVWGDFVVGTSTGVGVPQNYPLLFVKSGEGGISNGVGIGTTTVSGTMLTVGTTTPALVVSQNGNVGIGTASPSTRLDIQGGNVRFLSSGLITYYATSTDGYLGYVGMGSQIVTGSAANDFAISTGNASANMVFGANNAEKMRITSAGNVGIGTTTPRYLLDVWGDFGAGTSTDTNTPMLYVDSGDGGAIGIGTSTVSSNFLTVGTTTEYMVIDRQGNVGIATSTPSDTFAVQGNIIGSGNIVVYGTAATSTFGAGIQATAIKITDSPTANYVLTSDANGYGYWSADSVLTGSNWKLTASQNALTPTSTVGIHLNASSTFAADLVVSSDLYESDTFFVDASEGRIGIGTTTLAGLLTVGTSTLSLVVDPAGNVGIATTTFVTEGGQTAKFKVGGYSDLNGIRISGGDTANTIYKDVAFGITSGGVITIDPATTMYLVLQADGGNVGIGTTGPSSKLTVFGGDLTVGDGTATTTITYGVTGAATSTFAGDISTIGVISVGDGSSTTTISSATSTFAGGVQATAIKLTQEPTAGYVLTSDANGYGYWSADSVLTGSNWKLTASQNALTPTSTVGIHLNASSTFAATTTVNTGGFVVDGNRLYVSENGNVGIGTAAPGYKLDVSGSLRSTTVALLGTSVVQGGPSATDITSNATLLLSGVGGNYLAFGQYDSSGLFAQWIQSAYQNPTTATYNIILQPLGGNVGIGNTGPTSPLTVVGSIVSSADGSATTTIASGVSTFAGGLISQASSTFTGGLSVGTTTDATPLFAIDSGGQAILAQTAMYQPIYGSDDGLVLYLPFSEGMTSSSAEIAYDRSPFGNDGTATGMPMPARNATSGESGWSTTTCKVAGCMAFGGGGNDYVSIANSASLGPDYITVEAWFKTNVLGGKVLSKGFYGGAPRTFAIVLENTGRIYWQISLDGTTAIDIPAPLNTIQTGQWYHVVGTYDGSNGILYINGVQKASSANSGTLAKNTETLQIGSDRAIAETFFNGLIDEVRIYNRALSADEIRAHYLRGTGAGGAVLADKFRVVDTNNDVNLYVGSDGNVGIGTTTPSKLLTIATEGVDDGILIKSTNEDAVLTLDSGDGSAGGSGDYADIMFRKNGTLKAEIYVNTGADDDLYLQSSVSSDIILDGSNVGIGTTGPSSKLTVFGGDLTVGDGVATSTILNGSIALDYGISAATSTITATSTAGSLAVGTSNLYVSENGNVGIGTTGPTGKLHAVIPAWTNHDTDSQHVIFGSGTSGYGVRIGYNESSNIGSINVLKPLVAWGDLILQNEGGRVGIGTTGPSSKLTVFGGDLTVGDGIATSTILNGSISLDYGISAATSTITATSTAGSLAIGTSNLYVSENGNVGIGTTGPSSKLTVFGGALAVGDGSSTTTISSTGAITLGAAMDANSQAVTSVAGLSIVAGNNIRNTVDNSQYDLFGGTSAAQGAIITLVGADSGTDPGAIILRTTNVSLDGYHNRLVLSGALTTAVATWSDVTQTGIVLSGAITSNIGDMLVRDVTTGYINIRGGTAAAGKSGYIVLYGVDSGATGALSFVTPDAAGTGDVARLTISGKLATAVAGWANITHTGIELSGNLNTGNQWLSGDGGAEGIMIDNAGNVGIGTTGPSSKLTVFGGDLTVGDGIATSTILNGSITLDYGISAATSTITATSTAGSLAVGTSNLYVSENGNVGIGTAAPSSKLHILGASAVSPGSGNGNLTVEGGGGNGLLIGTISTSPFQTWLQSGFITDLATYSYPLGLNPLGGNVGIGTTGPSSKLTVFGGALAVGDGSSTTTISSTGAITLGANLDVNLKKIVNVEDINMGSASVIGYITGLKTFANKGDTIVFRTYNASDVITNRLSIQGGYDEAALTWANSNFVGVKLGGVLNTNNQWLSGDGGAEGIMIDNAGNVGIGTTGPSSKLTVFGGDLTVGDGIATSTILNGSITLDYGISAATSTITATSTAGSLAVGTSNLYVSENGNVGIGTAGPGTKLDVRVTADGLNDVATFSSILTNWTAGYGPRILFKGGTDNRDFGAIASALSTTGTGADAYLSFYTRNAETLGERMRILSSGNVGIGNTGPTSPLTVVGSIVSSADGSATTTIASGVSTFAGGLISQASSTFTGNLSVGTTTDATPLFAIDSGGQAILAQTAMYQPIYGSDDGLVLYLPFSEGMTSSSAEIAYDRSPYGNDGTLTGFPMPAATATSGSGWATTTCKAGACLTFDGGNDSISLGLPSSLTPTTTDQLTLEAWIKPITADNDGIMGFIGTVSDMFQLLLLDDPSDRLYFYIKTVNGNYGGTFSTQVTMGVWTHVVAVYNGTDMRVYANGILDATIPSATGNLARFTGTDIRIGMYNTTGFEFDGSIDEARIYNRALSADEVRAHYLRGTGAGGAVLADKFRVIGTDNNVDFIINAGNVGIGTTTPANILTVNSASASAFVVDSNGLVGIGVSNPTTALDVNGLIRVRNPQGETTAPTRTNNGEFAFAYVSSVYALFTRINGTNVYFSAAGTADVSEYFNNGENSEIPAGEVVSLDLSQPNRVVRTKKVYNQNIIGVVSEGGTRMGDKTGEKSLEPEKYVNVGLLGQVPVKVSLENGPIAIGDYLTSSNIPGVAMKATQAGRVIGMALEPFDSSTTTGQVMVFVNPHWWGGELSSEGLLVLGDIATSTGSGFAGDFAAKLMSMVEVVVDTITGLPKFIVNGILEVKNDVITHGVFKNIVKVAKTVVEGRTIVIENAFLAEDSRLKVESEDGESISFVTYSIVSPRKEIILSGSGKLLMASSSQDVEAKIAFHPSFSALISTSTPIRTVVSPTSYINSSLYISEKSIYGFTVRAVSPQWPNDGFTFDWIVTARLVDTELAEQVLGNLGAGAIATEEIPAVLASVVNLDVNEPVNGSNRPCSSEVGVCQIGVQIYQDGVWGECMGAVFPSEEILDQVDNNCNGQIDEGLMPGGSTSETLNQEVEPPDISSSTAPIVEPIVATSTEPIINTTTTDSTVTSATP